MSQRGLLWPGMATALRTGLSYFAIVFGIAFLFGTVRTLVLEPRLGEAAVLVELPIIVGASWAVARALLWRRRFSLTQRAVVGGSAFALTMLAEIVLAWLMRGQDPAAWAADVATPIGLAGLAGQVAFGVMPLLVRRPLPSAEQAG